VIRRGTDLETNEAEAGITALSRYFFSIQKLLKQSSLDKRIHLDHDRYDERGGKRILSDRDKIDKQVAQNARQIISSLEFAFDSNSLDLFSFKNDEPVVYVIRKEIEAMILLTNRITKTIKDLL